MHSSSNTNTPPATRGFRFRQTHPNPGERQPPCPASDGTDGAALRSTYRPMVGRISIRTEILNESGRRIESFVINAHLVGNDPPHLQGNLRLGSRTATSEELLIRNRR